MKRHSTYVANQINKYLAIIILGGLSVALLVTIVHLPRIWPRVDGIVLDSAENKPIEGVFVLAVWEGSVPRVVERETTAYRIDVTKTDREGRFRLPSWLEPPNWIADKRMYLQYYKAGFRPHVWRDYGMAGTTFMKKDDRPNTERLEYLLLQSNYLGIGSDQRRREILFDYHKALHTEAVNLVNTHEQSLLLQKIRYYIASEWEGKDTFHTFKDGESYFKKKLGMKFPGEPKYKNAVYKAAGEIMPQNNDSSAATVDDGQFSVQPQDAVSQTIN